MAASDDTVGKQRGNLIPFKPGESGNPAGRPKGARSKLGERFLSDLLADFETHGAAAIAKARETDPAAYIRIIAGLLPREVKVDPIAALTDEELEALIKALTNEVAGDC